MRRFDTKVQYLKYRVLCEGARQAWNGKLLENIMNIPEIIVPGKESTMHCCIYKDRAIISKQVKIAIGGDKENPNVIEVIDIACDECSTVGYEITDFCRGCLAHRCENACPRGAIYYDYNHKAHIDKEKCIECGLCAKVCPYSAIINRKRPCQIACKVKAISINEDGSANIDNSKCIECGACVYQCPFGAIVDKSYILDVIDIIKKSNDNSDYKVYAVVAPSISGQFLYAKIGQVITGLKKLGFYDVVEAGLGADMVADTEAQELAEKGFLTSSCCPAFVSYIKKAFPNMVGNISHNLSPMAEISKHIKEKDKSAKVVFIGPCTAKKSEIKLDTVKPYVDVVMTFEELQAMFDSRDIDINTLEEGSLNDASFYGRIFARSGGLSEAVAQAIKENNLEDFELKSCICNGVDECKLALTKAQRKVLKENFIEGMVCTDGCIGGAGCLTHGAKNKAQVDKYGKEASEKSIKGAIQNSKI